MIQTDRIKLIEDKHEIRHQEISRDREIQIYFQLHCPPLHKVNHFKSCIIYYHNYVLILNIFMIMDYAILYKQLKNFDKTSSGLYTCTGCLNFIKLFRRTNFRAFRRFYI